MSVWDARAAAYRRSPEHAEGEDLDTFVAWCAPASGIEVLDVASGGGHAARRLREDGCRVTTADSSPGMSPDVVCVADDVPFADESFDVVACRIAAHHFDDVARAVDEMARVSRGLVVIEDTLYESETIEEAEKLRDVSHVRAYTEKEWRAFFEEAGLDIEEVAFLEKRHRIDEWLARTGCAGKEAGRVRTLLADRTADGEWSDTKILLRGRKRR